MKIKGFTLAEVLITIGIVGVVATMTMPALVQKYRTVEYTSKIKKAYTTLSVAMNEYLRSSSADKLSQTAFINNAQEELKKVLRVVASGRLSSDLYQDAIMQITTLSDVTINPGNYNEFAANRGIITADGTLIAISDIQGNYEATDTSVVYKIAIDTNGQKKPNQFGRDIFFYDILNNGDVSPRGGGEGTEGISGAYISGVSGISYDHDCYRNGGYGTTCSAILMDAGWEMNY